MPPRDTDEAALEAFKNAFGEVVPIRRKDAKIRLGKAVIALDDVEKALQWARSAGFTDNEIQGFQNQYDELRVEAETQSQLKSPDMKFLDNFKDTCRNLVDTIRKTRKKQKIQDLPNNSGIFVNDIPGLDDLSPNERQQKIAEIRQKVCRGNNLTQGILQGDPNYIGTAPTKDTIVDMCWYFKGMAQEKLGTTYQQGAMTLPDPDGRLAKFFDSCPDIYPRGSSHLRPQQKQGGSQGRGIDIGGALPGGMNTVLVHPFVTDQGERRLYVKFESAGAYGHLGSKSREVARRPENEQDKAQSKAHTDSFMGGDKDKDKSLTETREGTVDLAVQAAYQKVFDKATDYRKILEVGKQRSKQNSQGKINGFTRVLSYTALAPNYWDVQSQATNIKNLLVELQKNPRRGAQLKAVIVEWRDAMKEAGYDTDAFSRLGDEVVLRKTDLKSVQSNIQTDGDIDGDRALIKAFDLFEMHRARQARVLEGKKQQTPYVFYKKLVFNVGAQQHVFENVLTVDTEARQFEDYVEPNTKVATGIINKGTNLLKQKHFEFTGDVTQIEMFAALSATGWNMANLKRPSDLKLKT